MILMIFHDKTYELKWTPQFSLSLPPTFLCICLVIQSNNHNNTSHLTNSLVWGITKVVVFGGGCFPYRQVTQEVAHLKWTAGGN